MTVTSKSVPTSGSLMLANVTSTTLTRSSPRSLPLAIFMVPTATDAAANRPFIAGRCSLERRVTDVRCASFGPHSLTAARSSQNHPAAPPSASLGPSSTLSKISTMTLSSTLASVQTSWLSGTGRKSLTST